MGAPGRGRRPEVLTPVARIPEAEVERLKREVSCQRLAEDAGVKLAHSGRDTLIGRCVFHNDRTPSLVITPSKNLWHCLGACQTGGSSIDWVKRAYGVEFRHAVELMRSDLPPLPAAAGGVKASSIRHLPSPVELEADDRETLREVIDYYHQSLKQSPEALAYLERRGLHSTEAIERFRIGYANRTLGYRLPEKSRKSGEELRGRLQRLGILRASGHEHFNGSIVIPVFDEHASIVEVYGRKIRDDLRPGTPLHLYLPGPHRGIFNHEALAASPEIILCEALLDALTFWCAGYKNVTASYGVQGFTDEHLEAFQRHRIERVLIAYDRDEAGGRAAQVLAEKLQAAGIDCFRIDFPHGMDANEYACKVTPASKSLGLLVRKATWLGKGKPPRIEPAATATVAVSSRADQILETATKREALLAAEAAASEAATSPATAAPAEPANASSAIAAAAEASPSPDPAQDPDLPEPKTPPAAASWSRIPAPQPIAAAAPPIDLEASPLPAPAAAPTVDAEVKDDEVLVHFGDRHYRVRGLPLVPRLDRLEVNVFVQRDGVMLEDSGLQAGYFVDSFNLYKDVPRVRFAKQAAFELKVEEGVIKKDLGRLLLKLEEVQEARAKKAKEPPPEAAPVLSEAEKLEALALLKDPRLFERVLEDFERAGIVGEEANKLIGYLAAVSRKLDDPLAVLIQASSAAGKSSLLDGVLAFVPEEEQIKYSALTGQALFYQQTVRLKHKVLAIVEEEGAERATYALKLLQSEKKLTIASTGKDPKTGRLGSETYVVEGPTMLLLTTTAVDLDEELQNRFLVLSVDEEREQTRAIHRLQRKSYTLAGRRASHQRERILKLHRNAQRLLRPLEVANDYAELLTFPDDRPRMRRDQKKYLTLINAIAFVRQYQRSTRKDLEPHEGALVEVEYVAVELDDIALANRLANEAFGRTLDELAPQTRRLVIKLEQMVREQCARRKMTRSDFRFSRKDVRAYTGFSQEQLQRHLHRLVDLEYLVVHRGGRGQSFVYELLYDGKGQDGKPFVMGLLDVEELKRTGTTQESAGEKGEFCGPSSPHLRPICSPSSGDENAAKVTPINNFQKNVADEVENARRRSTPENRSYPQADDPPADPPGETPALEPPQKKRG